MSDILPDSEDRFVEGVLDEKKERLLVEVKTDVTSTHIAGLKGGLAKVIQMNPAASWKSVYLDMRNSRLIDSVGVNWMFSETNQLRGEHKKMVLRVSSPAISRVIEFFGLDRVVTLKYRRRKQTR